MDELMDTYKLGERHCRPCDRWFSDEHSALQHLTHSGNHCYCARCDREFVNQSAKGQHLVHSGSHNRCHRQECRDEYANGADWESRAELLQHFRETAIHHYCFICNFDFASQQILHVHLENTQDHHWCSRCERLFLSEAALDQHRKDSSNHFPCGDCPSDFFSLNELTQHKKVHQLRRVKCSCSMKFACLSALVIHWEAGKCITNRAHLNQTILHFPEYRRFTVKEFLQYLREAEDRIHDVDSLRYYDRRLEKWVCPIDDCSASFPSMAVLNQHLGSPFHDVNAFQCPDCGARFTCLSGLLQHVENSKICPEGIDTGTGCMGRLWAYLLDEFQMLPHGYYYDRSDGEIHEYLPMYSF